MSITFRFALQTCS